MFLKKKIMQFRLKLFLPGAESLFSLLFCHISSKIHENINFHICCCSFCIMLFSVYEECATACETQELYTL